MRISWNHGSVITISSFILVVIVLVWGVVSIDPDFEMVDYFAIMGIVMVAITVASAFIKHNMLRRVVFVAAVCVPVVLIVSLEMLGKYGDVKSLRFNIERVDDRLLRYQYVPGAKANGTGERWNNSLGLNDREYSTVKPPDVYRIAVLGDSVPNDGSMLNEETFHERLETMFNDQRFIEHKTGTEYRKVEVLNVSCEGYNTLQEVRLFEKVYDSFKPDLVIIAYVLNDPFIQDGSYRRFGNSFFMFKVTMFVEYMIFDIYQKPLADLFFGFHGRYSFDLIVKSSFERLKLLSELHGFDVMVGIIPLILSFEDHPFGDIYQQVADLAESQGFGAVQMFDRFKDVPIESVSKGGDFTHPLPAGHAIMANILNDYILEHYLKVQGN